MKEKILRPRDKRTLRSFTLPNQLDVLLIHDPDLNKSAVALDVAVGAMEDPWEYEGLAHFLEHMLFLGTEAYPSVDEYNRFLNAHQGYSNAFTASENTNYHFEVAHEGFEGALDRFAHFFIDPLFHPDYVDRELNAVHSEHQKNLQDDNWRIRRVMRSLHKAEHPRTKFSTGNLDTLKPAGRDRLIQFYKSYYSANQMKLAVMTSLPLEGVEAQVRAKFAKVPNYDRSKLGYNAEIDDPSAFPRFVQINPVKEIRKIELSFTTPSGEPYWESKPGQVLSHLIGHEGKYSLLSYLKQKNWATGLSAWLESASYVGIFHISVSLTEEGLKEWQEVVRSFFAYMELIRSANGYPQYTYEELKTMAQLDYDFGELREGANVASHYASRMQLHAGTELEKRDSLFFKYDTEVFSKFVRCLTPENLCVTLISKNLSGTEQIEKEKYYGTEYSVTRLDPASLQPRESDYADLRLPLPNPYIPKAFPVKIQPDVKPEKIVSETFGELWFQPDIRYGLPKALWRLDIMTPTVNESPASKALSTLYVSSLNESLNEWTYQLHLADINLTIVRTELGLSVEVEGYSDRLLEVVKDFTGKLTELTLSEQHFAAVKEELLKHLRNAPFDAAYQQTTYHLRHLLDLNVIHRDELYSAENVDLISHISLQDVKAFAHNILAEFYIKSVAFGCLEAEEVRSAFQGVLNNLGASRKALPQSKRPGPRNLLYPEQSEHILPRLTQVNNHCLALNFQFGPRDLRLNGIIRIGHSLLQPDFFTQLRTEQQLGYLVHCGLNFQENLLGMLFLIQSADYNPDEIRKRVEAWIDSVADGLSQTDAETFGTIKASVIHELRETDKTMADYFQHLSYEALTLEGVFGYRAKIADATESVTQEDVIRVFGEAFSRTKRRLVGVSLHQEAEAESVAIPPEPLLEAKRLRQVATHLTPHSQELRS